MTFAAKFSPSWSLLLPPDMCLKDLSEHIPQLRVVECQVSRNHLQFANLVFELLQPPYIGRQPAVREITDMTVYLSNKCRRGIV
jgi:hypothetical protein